MNHSTSSDLFEWSASHQAKEAGMEQAADAHPTHLEVAREIARHLADTHGTVHADMVGEELARRNITVGPWAGSIFKGGEWEFTGSFVSSSRRSNHGRLLRVWRKAG